MTIKELVNKAHANAANHGFWDPPPDFGTSIALIHSELSEALEEARGRNKIVYYSGEGKISDIKTQNCKKPEGIAPELADAVIRIADLCGYMGIDLEAAIAEKMAYNESRPYKHGKIF